MALNKTPTQMHHQHGIGYLTVIVFGSLLAATAYAGYFIGPWFYEYFELESHMSQLIKLSQVDSEVEMRKKLHGFLRSYDLPISEKDIRIAKHGSIMVMDAEWEKTFSIPWRGKIVDLHTFQFHAHAEGTP